MSNDSYFYRILTKICTCGEIFVNIPEMKFHKALSCDSQVVHAETTYRYEVQNSRFTQLPCKGACNLRSTRTNEYDITSSLFKYLSHFRFTNILV